VVDPLGRVIKSLPLRTEGVLDAPLPQAIAPTPYARAGDGPAGLLIGLAFLWAWRSRRGRGKLTQNRSAPNA
jgi:apolipoprotein N-acyltransferase